MKQPPMISRTLFVPRSEAGQTGHKALLFFSLFALTAPIGCYHATGISRPPLVAEEIPAVGGDRVGGLKAVGAPGDYYLGSDFIQLVVDGTPFTTQSAAIDPGAGGSIIDIGDVELDQNYLRVSPPSDRLERLSQVVNQDPSLRVIYDSLLATNGADNSSIQCQGRIYDPNHKLSSQDWVPGITVTHSISLGHLDRFLSLETTVTNTGSTAVNIYNIGDHVSQKGGGYRFNVPAGKDLSKNLINNWGVQIPDSGPGTDFNNNPYSAVQAPMVALMCSEPSASSMDYHCSLGILPVDQDSVAVTSSPQDVFNQPRPIASPNIVVGGILDPGAKTSLAPGKTVTYKRRIYVLGGALTHPSGTSGNYGYYSQTLRVPQDAGLFNAMALDAYTLRPPKDKSGNLVGFGTAVINTGGTADLKGPKATEVRIEKYTKSMGIYYNKDFDSKAYATQLESYKTDTNNWELVRTEWMEPLDSTGPSTGTFSLLLPGDTFYRITFRDREHLLPPSVPPSYNWLYKNSTVYYDANDNPINSHDDPSPLLIRNGYAWTVSGYLSPDYTGETQLIAPFGEHMVTASAANPPNAASYAWQPLRVTAICDESPTGDAVAHTPRMRYLKGQFYSPTKTRNFDPSSYAAYVFQGGNEIFGASLSGFYWLPQDSSYTLYGTRGPLTSLSTQKISQFVGQGDTSHSFLIPTYPLPVGWTTFDLPGPSQATTGGYLPGEKFASALAEGIQVVGNTEQDLHVSASDLYTDFRAEFDWYFSDDSRVAVLKDPFLVSGRSTDLSGYGSVTSLFTPEPTNEHRGGARESSTWTLADFINLAQGEYTVVHRPRGPQGLFTLQNFQPTVKPLSQTPWWNATGHLASGTTQGAFDAIELLRGEYTDSKGQPMSQTNVSGINEWFAEFKTLRNDWFAMLKQQSPSSFTKGLGLSSAKYSYDTPVGLARTYLKAQGYNFTLTSGFTEDDLSPVLKVLKSGAAVASTGPLLDVTVKGATSGNSATMGGLVSGTNNTVTVTVDLWGAVDWVPVEEVRVVVNGIDYTSNAALPHSAFNVDPSTKAIVDPSINGWVVDTTSTRTVTQKDGTTATITGDWRHWTKTFTVPLSSLLPAGKDAWVIVEGGVPLGTTGAYLPNTPWANIMRGIYPVAVTNPIFVDVNGDGYKAPGL